MTQGAVAAHGCGCGGGHRENIKARRDDGTSLGHGEDIERAKENERDENNNIEVKEREQEDELDGFWVLYGQRNPRRWLPPPIPALVARAVNGYL